MIQAPSAAPRSRSAIECALALALGGVAVLLALALAGSQFQPGQNSDLLWPQVYAHSLIDPAHPLSGWKFGSATFWFPDDVIFLPLYWLCGSSGFNYPLYTVAIYLLIGITLAWSLAAAGVEQTRATLAGFLALEVVLLGQIIPGQARWLWLVGIPGRHGGNLATGFALVALTLGAARSSRWSRARTCATITLMTFGLLSDALLVFHWIIPLAVALGWLARRQAALKPIFVGFLRRAGIALGLCLLVRGGLALAQWFLFYRLARDWPLPASVGQTLTQFFADFTQHGLLASLWLFGLLAAAALFAATKILRTQYKVAAAVPIRLALLTGLGSLALAWATPMITLYWHDADSFRYLLNWLVVPAWMLALWICVNPDRARWLPGLALAAGLLGAIYALPKIDRAKLIISRPPEALALRDYCTQHHLREGLADFWNAQLLRVEWDFQGPDLGQIRDRDFVYFWCNNAFDYFPAREDGRGLRQPNPQFVILNGLDQAGLTTWLGGGTLQVETLGPFSIALLTPEQSRRAGELITSQVEDALHGRRAEWLKSQLAPP